MKQEKLDHILMAYSLSNTGWPKKRPELSHDIMQRVGEVN